MRAVVRNAHIEPRGLSTSHGPDLHRVARRARAAKQMTQASGFKVANHRARSRSTDLARRRNYRIPGGLYPQGKYTRPPAPKAGRTHHLRQVTCAPATKTSTAPRTGISSAGIGIQQQPCRPLNGFMQSLELQGLNPQGSLSTSRRDAHAAVHGSTTERGSGKVYWDFPLDSELKRRETRQPGPAFLYQRNQSWPFRSGWLLPPMTPSSASAMAAKSCAPARSDFPPQVWSYISTEPLRLGQVAPAGAKRPAAPSTLLFENPASARSNG